MFISFSKKIKRDNLLSIKSSIQVYHDKNSFFSTHLCILTKMVSQNVPSLVQKADEVNEKVVVYD